MSLMTRLFGKSNKSGQVAKERLQYMLKHDRQRSRSGLQQKRQAETAGAASKYVETETSRIELVFANPVNKIA